MIRDNLYNFEYLKYESGLYRQNLKHRKDSRNKEIESFLYSKASNISKYSFFNINKGRIISSNNFVRNINDFKYVLYQYLKENLQIENVLDVFKNKTDLHLKKINKELKILEAQSKERDLELNSKYSKVKIFNIFQEKDFEETYDLKDIKTNFRIEKKYQASYKSGYIEIPEMEMINHVPQKIEILNEESFLSDSLISLKKDKETSYIWRDEKFFNFIVGKKENHFYGEQLKHREVRLNLVISYNGKINVNQLHVRFASSLPIDIDSIWYWDIDAWVRIDNFGINKFNQNNEIVFDTIKTKKIKLCLKQNKYIELAKKENLSNKEKIINSFSEYYNFIEEDEILKIHDFSIYQIDTVYKIYKRFGFYREAENISVSNLISFYIDENYIYNTEDCFVEKEAHIVLYGDENTKAFKKDNVSTPRLNCIIPIPKKSKIQTELLVFNKNEAKLSFFPKIKKDNLDEELHDIIQVYKNNVLLNMYTDYIVSIDEKDSYIESAIRIGELEKQIKEKISGLVYVKLLVNKNPEDIIKCNYKIDNFFYLEESKKIFFSNLEIGLVKSLQKSKGFIRPRFMFRNYSLNNSSSMIKDYRVLIEENNPDDDKYIEYATYIESVKENTRNGI